MLLVDPLWLDEQEGVIEQESQQVRILPVTTGATSALEWSFEHQLPVFVA